MKCSDLFGHKKHGSGFLAYLKGPQGSQLVEARGETQEAAEAALVGEIRGRFNGHYLPLCLRFRGNTALIWRNGDEWVYGHVHGENPHPQGMTIGGWTTQEEVERVARLHLAHNGWDEQEEHSPLIRHPADQAAFTTWAREEKQRRWRWRGLRAVGWSDEEIRHIIGGFFHFLAAERLQQLGDPRPLVQKNREERTQIIARYQTMLAHEDDYESGVSTPVLQEVLAALERGEGAAHFRQERDANWQQMAPAFHQSVAWVWNEAIMVMAEA